MTDKDTEDEAQKLLECLKSQQVGETPPVFDHALYDGLVFFYHRSLRDRRLLGTTIPLHKTAVLINNEKWVSEGAGVTLDTYLGNVKILGACNSHILQAFSAIHKNVLPVSQCVSSREFYIISGKPLNKRRTGGNFVIGWSGDFHNPLKNIEMVKEACFGADVKLLISKNRTRTALNEWYNTQIDAVLCASSSEGGPMMLLEAAACGVPVITTPVGLARDIVRDKESGLIVENISQMKDAILSLAYNLELRQHLAMNLHEEVMQRWTYEARLPEIKELLNRLLQK